MKPCREFPDPRSIPMVGRGIRGTVPGTDPLQALLAKEARGKLDLTPLEPIERPAPTERHVRRRLGRRVSNQRHL